MTISHSSKRIALVSHSALFGGAEKMLLRLATLLRRRTVYDPILFVADFGETRNQLPDLARNSGIETVLIPKWHWPQHLQWCPEYVFSESVIASSRVLIDQFFERKIDLVVGNTITNIVSPLAAIKCNLPLLMWIHETSISSANACEKAAPFEKFVLEASNEILCCSDWVGRYWRDRFGVDFRKQWNWTEEPVERTKKRDDITTFVCLNHYHAHKGLDMLLDACRLLMGRSSDFRVRIFGSGPKKNDLERSIREKDLAHHVVVHNEIDDVDGVYGDADVLLQPSDIEPFGLTIIEAMSHRLPVIATCSGGPEEIVDDEVTGFLVPIGDAAAFAGKMHELIIASRKREVMGKAGYEKYLSRFTSESACDTVIPTVENIVNGFSGHAPNRRKSYLKIAGLLKTMQKSESKVFATTELPSAIVHVSQCAKGEIGLKGNLGHEELDPWRNLGFKEEFASDLFYQSTPIQLPVELEGWTTIGLHADSLLEMEFTKTVELKGALNGSAFTVRKPGTLRFSIDGTVIGEADGPMATTDSFVLPKGRYRLETKAAVTNEYCHTVWAYRPCEKPIASVDNTAFLSVAAFEDVEKETELLMDSAKRLGYPVVLLDAGQKWEGFYQHKILDMVDRFRRLRDEGMRYVVLLDASDIIFIHPIDIFLAKFNALNKGKIVVCADVLGFSHPAHRPWILLELQDKMNTPRAEINAGVVMGEIDLLIRAFEEIITIREEYVNGVFRSKAIRRLHEECGERWIDDDQFLHYLNALVHPEWYEIDGNKRLTALITGYRKSPSCLDDPREGDSICGASIIHGTRLTFPGPWTDWSIGARSKWWEYDPEIPPVRLSRVEVNIVYSCNLKCEYCTHYGRHVHGMEDLDTLKSWFETWHRRIAPDQVRLLGGEPLLHPDCAKVLREARIHWPHAELTFVTNGLVDPREKEEFYKTVKDTNCLVIVSRHQDNPEYNERFHRFLNILAERNIRHMIEESRYGFNRVYRLDESSRPVPFESHPAHAWNNCNTKNNCPTLLGNRLYKCPQIGCAVRGRQAGQLSEAWDVALEYAAMTPDSSYEDLLRFASEGAVPCCSICPERYENASMKDKLGNS